LAVYTHLGAEDLAVLIAEYDVGAVVSAKGIAEGVSNSNWVIETRDDEEPEKGGRFILTVYERRIETRDLPFFLGLLDHLSDQGCPVPRTIHDRSGAAWRQVLGKAAALIEFLPGVSVDRPSTAQARAVGEALAGVHLASADFPGIRENDLRPADWQALFDQCGRTGLASLDPNLPDLVARRMDEVAGRWPEALPRSIIPADLFPDNVLLLGNEVSGLIDFYFACTDITAYDLAVTHAAWCFADQGRTFRPSVAAALLAGYESVRPIDDAERAALAVLAQGAALRFVATRSFDWLNTPADALVARKDPLDFARRLEFYAEAGASAFAPGAG
jgi:homoserine kinase type II